MSEFAEFLAVPERECGMEWFKAFCITDKVNFVLYKFEIKRFKLKNPITSVMGFIKSFYSVFII